MKMKIVENIHWISTSHLKVSQKNSYEEDSHEYSLNINNKSSENVRRKHCEGEDSQKRLNEFWQKVSESFWEKQQWK